MLNSLVTLLIIWQFSMLRIRKGKNWVEIWSTTFNKYDVIYCNSNGFNKLKLIKSLLVVSLFEMCLINWQISFDKKLVVCAYSCGWHSFLITCSDHISDLIPCCESCNWIMVNMIVCHFIPWWLKKMSDRVIIYD